MLRELRCNCADAPAADFTAKVELKTGMAVVKDYATKELKLPESATDEGIFVVQKAPIPTGLNANFVDFSDYEEEFNTVEAGACAVAYHYAEDSAFATDQYDETLTAAGYVNAGTDGKWAPASGTSKFYCTGLISDGLYHTLARIEVVG